MNVNFAICTEDYNDFCKGKPVQSFATAQGIIPHVNITCELDEVEFMTEKIERMYELKLSYKALTNSKSEPEKYTEINNYVKRIIPSHTKTFAFPIDIGDTVIIKDAMDPSYIGKEGIVEAISSNPLSYKLTIDGKPGSWGCAWLRSCVQKKIETPTIENKQLIDKYDMVVDAKKDICRASLNGKWFHCTTTGMMPLYAERFDSVSPFTNDIAIAKLDGKEFHIGMDGKALYEERFDSLGPFMSDTAKAVLDDDYFKINKKGKRV